MSDLISQLPVNPNFIHIGKTFIPRSDDVFMATPVSVRWKEGVEGMTRKDIVKMMNDGGLL